MKLTKNNKNVVFIIFSAFSFLQFKDNISFTTVKPYFNYSGLVLYIKEKLAFKSIFNSLLCVKNCGLDKHISLCVGWQSGNETNLLINILFCITNNLLQDLL